MFPSIYATNYFQVGGNYYNPPIRNWAFDNNFTNMAGLPPLTPMVVEFRHAVVPGLKIRLGRKWNGNCSARVVFFQEHGGVVFRGKHLAQPPDVGLDFVHVEIRAVGQGLAQVALRPAQIAVQLGLDVFLQKFGV